MILSFLNEKGELEKHELNSAITAAARELNHELDQYFVLDDQTLIVNTDRLILSHLQVKGIFNALRFMKEARVDRLTKRNPITIKSWREHQYLVIDGNSTLAVAQAAQWPTIACKMVT